MEERLGAQQGKRGNRKVFGLLMLRLNLETEESGQINHNHHGTKISKGQATGSNLGTILGPGGKSLFAKLWIFLRERQLFPAPQGK